MAAPGTGRAGKLKPAALIEVCATNKFLTCFRRRRLEMIRGAMSSLVLAGAMLFSVAGVACGGHHAYRVYDPYYTDYHQWNRDEDLLLSTVGQ